MKVYVWLETTQYQEDSWESSTLTVSLQQLVERLKFSVPVAQHASSEDFTDLDLYMYVCIFRVVYESTMCSLYVHNK